MYGDISHSRIVESQLLLARVVPSGEKATDVSSDV